jgi:hypothetical protein
LGEVEVGEETLDDAELMAGADEDAGGTRMGVEAETGVGLEGVGVGQVGAVFQGAGGGGPGSYDAAAFAEGHVYGFGGGCGEGVVLGVEVDVFESFGSDGLEGSEAYVEGYGFYLDVILLEFFEDFGGEVEAGCGGSGRSGFVGLRLSGIDGLVTVSILFGVVAVDVRGERHVAYFVEDGEEVGCGGEAEGALSEVGGGYNFGFEDEIIFMVEEEVLAGLDLAAGTYEGDPLVGGKLPG